MHTSIRLSPDSGETLIESLISILMIGIAVAALLGAVASGSSLTGDHRKLTVSDITLKSVVETVKTLPYIPGATTYAIPGGPAGYSAQVISVTCWPNSAGTTFSTSAFVPCNAVTTDHGLQLVTVSVRSDDGRAYEKTDVMKRK